MKLANCSTEQAMSTLALGAVIGTEAVPGIGLEERATL